MSDRRPIEPVMGADSFVVRLTEQGWRAEMVDDLGNPFDPLKGWGEGGAIGESSLSASEAIVDCLRRTPFDFSTDHASGEQFIKAQRSVAHDRS